MHGGGLYKFQYLHVGNLCTWNNTRDLLQNTLAEVNKLSAGGNNDARAMENQTAGATQPHL